jgi:glutaredoxin 3
VADLNARYELFGTRSCPYTRELREWLDWKGHDYVEFDVEADAAALDRMLALSGGRRTVPILVEDGRVTQIGWQGRGCVVGPATGRR